MKENQLLTARVGGKCPVRSAFTDLKAGTSRALRKRRRIGQQWVWLSGIKLDRGERLILAGNHRFSQPLEVHGRRWEIEHLFQCLKGRGFHREETRLTRYFWIKKMALLALAFCWAHKTVELKHQAVKPLKTKKHERLEQNLFHYVMDYLTNSLLQGFQKIEDRLRLLVLFFVSPLK